MPISFNALIHDCGSFGFSTWSSLRIAWTITRARSAFVTTASSNQPPWGLMPFCISTSNVCWTEGEFGRNRSRPKALTRRLASWGWVTGWEDWAFLDSLFSLPWARAAVEAIINPTNKNTRILFIFCSPCPEAATCSCIGPVVGRISPW